MQKIELSIDTNCQSIQSIDTGKVIVTNYDITKINEIGCRFISIESDSIFINAMNCDTLTTTVYLKTNNLELTQSLNCVFSKLEYLTLDCEGKMTGNFGLYHLNVSTLVIRGNYTSIPIVGNGIIKGNELILVSRNLEEIDSLNLSHYQFQIVNIQGSILADRLGLDSSTNADIFPGVSSGDSIVIVKNWKPFE